MDYLEGIVIKQWIIIHAFIIMVIILNALGYGLKSWSNLLSIFLFAF
jgi:hypothetical protein